MKRLISALAVLTTAALLSACGPEKPVGGTSTPVAVSTSTESPKAVSAPTETPSSAPVKPLHTAVPMPTPQKPSIAPADPSVGNLLPKLTDADTTFVQELAKFDPSIDPAAGKFIAQRGCKMLDQGSSPEKTLRALKETKALDEKQTETAFAVGTVVYCPSHMGDVLNYARTL